MGLKQEKEVRERKPSCLKRLEVISPITDFFFFKVQNVYVALCIYIHTYVCMYTHMYL